MNILPTTKRFAVNRLCLFLVILSACFWLNSSSAGAQELLAHTKATVAVKPTAAPVAAAPKPVNPVTPAIARDTAAPQAHLFATVETATARTVAVAPAMATTPLPVYVVTAEATQLEQRVFALINQERQAEGLAPLIWDADAAQLARAHSYNMAQSAFFNHTDPQGRDVEARARELKINGWRALGENIAYNKGYEQPADFAVERWLKSFSHKENISRASFTHTAIGVARSAEGRIYFTQVFLARS